MSVEITTAFVEQYSANVRLLAQQSGSRLRGTVDVESITGKNAFFEQVGATAAQLQTTRHADTPQVDTPHARRRVSVAPYNWADLIDDEDKVRMLIDPASTYAKNAANALNRSLDDVIIAAADGTAYTGVDGSTSTAFDTNMVVDVQTRDVGVSAADLGMNVAKIIEAQRLLDANEVDEMDSRYIIWNARQRASLLNSTRATSGDYNTVKALTTGQINEFMGFTFVRSERIGTDANSDDKCLFYAKSGIKLAVGKDIMGRISERDDKNYSVQVYASMMIGATRMEETKVGYIECDTSAGPGA